MNPRFVRSLITLPSLLLLPSAFATSYTWTGNGNDNQWSTATNWSPAGVPSTNDTATINFASSSVLAGNTVFYNYTGANVTLSQLTISHGSSRFGGTSVLSIGANALNATNENLGDSSLGGPLGGEIDQSGNATNYTSNLTLGRNVGDAGFYNLSGNATLRAATENLGVSGHATFTQTGGVHLVSGSGNSGLFLAVTPSATANYSLQAGSLGSYVSAYIGYGGNATLTQTVGSFGIGNLGTTTPNLYLGYFAGSNGNYSMSTQFAALGVDNTIYVGYGGNGTMTQDAGTVSYTLDFLPPSLVLAYASTATGTYTLSGGGVMNLNSVTVGESGNATFNHTSGLVYASSVILANGTGSHASYTLGDGLLSDSGGITVGGHGNATFTQNGGSVTLGAYGSLTLGSSADGVGTYNLNNGTLSVGDGIFVGYSGTATFNQSGGSVFASYSWPLEISSKSSYLLSNGTLTVPQIDDSGFFSRTGGTLTPTFLNIGGTAYFHNVNTKLTFLLFSGSTATLNITDTKVVVEPSSNRAATLANLQNQALYGRTHPTGIIDSLLPPNMAVAVIDNSALPTPLTTFGGIAVDPNSILISQELLGDANIDGKIDLTDLSTVLNNFGATTSSWTSGNFDGAASIDLTDLFDVLNNFGLTYANANTALVPSPTLAAPEPASLLLLTPALLLACHKRLRRPQPFLLPAPIGKN